MLQTIPMVCICRSRKYERSQVISFFEKIWWKNSQFWCLLKYVTKKCQLCHNHVQMSSNCVWGMSDLRPIIPNCYFCFFTILQNYVILWRHFDVLTSSWRQNGWHTPERPFLDEHNGVGFMSLSLLEPKLWLNMWFLTLPWPWPWPLFDLYQKQ